MIMANRIFLFFSFLIISTSAFSQKWHQYSDSLLYYINRGDLQTASQFSELADTELTKLKPNTDTLYADYLYSKGVLMYYSKKYSLNLFEEANVIWNQSKIKNFYKIMKIQNFLGRGYYSRFQEVKDVNLLNKSIESYELSYSISKEYKLNKGNIFLQTLFSLAALNKKDSLKTIKYSNEYIEIRGQTGVQEFDFNLITIYRFINDLEGQEIKLKEFLASYFENKNDDPEILFNIYFELLNNQTSIKRGNGDFIHPRVVIKHGEDALNIFNTNDLKPDIKLEYVLMSLSLAHSQLLDNINAKKYDNLKRKHFGLKLDFDKESTLMRLADEEDYKSYKSKFKQFELELKLKNDYNGLAQIYSSLLDVYEKQELTFDEINNRFEFILSKSKNLSSKEKLSFEITLVEFYFVSGTKLRYALNLCNQNLLLKDLDINSKLFLYRLKASIESKLGDPNSSTTLFNSLEFAKNIFGEYHPRLLEIYIDILEINSVGNYLGENVIATNILKIIYENKLENSEIGSKAWFYLAEVAKHNNNISDFFKYTNLCRSYFELHGNDFHSSIYFRCLLNLADLFNKKDDFESSRFYIEIVDKYFTKYHRKGLNEDSELTSAYYITKGDYYFYQKKYIVAKSNYLKALSNGENKAHISFKLIICNYSLNKNSAAAIKSFQKFDLVNNTNLGSEYIYFLTLRSGDKLNSRNILFKQLDKLKSNEFHKLSNDEVLFSYAGVKKYYEYLNTYLLYFNDSDFLKNYIDYRLYGKAILQLNLINGKFDDVNDNSLIETLNNNVNLINKLKELKNVNNAGDSSDSLKFKNREIEKILKRNKSPLNNISYLGLNSKLKPGDAYVEIVRINKLSRNVIIAPHISNDFTDSIFYGAIIIRKNNAPKFVLIDNSNQLEQKNELIFNKKIGDNSLDTTSYFRLFYKIEKELLGVKKLYFSPDGIYNFINIESLYNPQEGKYLIEYLKVQQINNLESIHEDSDSFKSKSNLKAILFGNPNYQMKFGENNLKDSLIFNPRSIESDLVINTKRVLKISALGESEKEISNIKSILKINNFDVEYFSSDSASEDNLKKIHSPNILHIASHGYFLDNYESSKAKKSLTDIYGNNSKVEPYLKSGLLLAGAQNTLNGIQNDGYNNGILSAEEVKSLELKDTELVVLSACDTGLGDYSVGQGVIGLQSALMIAGAKSIIMSLWEVNDEVSRKIMTSFYTNWLTNKMNKLDALVKAKLEIKIQYPQPYYWASFVLVN